MSNKKGNNRLSKGELSAEFGRTSIGTTVQDEKNIILQASSGESVYTPRGDTYAFTENKRRKQDRLDHKRKYTYQQLMIFISQMQESIEAELAHISQFLDKILLLNEEILDFINEMNTKVESIEENHQSVLDILDQSEPSVLEDKARNAQIKALLARYKKRTGKENVQIEDLEITILGQIAYEQSNTVPELKLKVANATKLYEEVEQESKTLSIHNIRLKEKYDDMEQLTTSEEKLSSLNTFHLQTSELKDKAKIMRDNITNKFAQLKNDHGLNTQTNSLINQERPIEIKTFGLSTPIPK